MTRAVGGHGLGTRGSGSGSERGSDSARSAAAATGDDGALGPLARCNDSETLHHRRVHAANEKRRDGAQRV